MKPKRTLFRHSMIERTSQLRVIETGHIAWAHVYLSKLCVEYSAPYTCVQYASSIPVDKYTIDTAGIPRYYKYMTDTKKRNERATITARLYPSTHALLRRRAFKRKISVAELIAEIVSGYKNSF